MIKSMNNTKKSKESAWRFCVDKKRTAEAILSLAKDSITSAA